LNACIHFGFFDDLAPRNLFDSQLHLPLEPGIVRKQAINGFLYQFVGASTGLGGKSVELGFLLLP
jgi:hypothetical protein